MRGRVEHDENRGAPLVDSDRPHPRLPLAFAIVAGLTAAEIFRQGAFYPRDALVVAMISVALIAASARARIDVPARRVAVAVAAFTLLWLFAAVDRGHPAMFLPLGASMIGFLAAFVVVRRLPADQRVQAVRVLATVGAAAAAIGLGATVLRHYPLSMPAQDLWRLSSTLTYSDAAGLLLGMTLLLALGLDQREWLARVDVYLCLSGLIATQSRGALLAVAIGAVLVPLAQAREARRSLLVGLVVGLVVVATSSGPARQPVAALVIVVGSLIAVVARRSTMRRRPTRRNVRIAVAATVCCAGIALAALHTPIQRRVELASTNDRLTEWHAAFEQWESSPWLGVGPDAPLHFHARDGTFAHFAHNEYLQVAADSGWAGLILLLLVGGTVIAAVRRDDTISSCACGALVAFAVAGALDFDWHLSALGLLAGCVAGLAGRRAVSTSAVAVLRSASASHEPPGAEA